MAVHLFVTDVIVFEAPAKKDMCMVQRPTLICEFPPRALCCRPLLRVRGLQRGFSLDPPPPMPAAAHARPPHPIQHLTGSGQQ